MFLLGCSGGICKVSRSPVDSLVEQKIITLEKKELDRSVVWEQEYFIGKNKKLSQEQADCISIDKGRTEQIATDPSYFKTAEVEKQNIHLQTKL
jgi:primosomal protein N'